MPRIFISYSRVDAQFTRLLVGRLNTVYRPENVWYDEHLYGGVQWWQKILQEIAACDVFIYLLSNESVTSPYCHAEFTEAQRLQKPIVTVQIRDKTKLSQQLQMIQYVDMKGGITDESLARLIRSIHEQAELPKKRRALWTPATPLPDMPTAESANTARSDVDTPTLQIARSENATTKPIGDSLVARATIIAAAIGAIALIASVILPRVLDGQPTQTDTPTPPSFTLTPTVDQAVVLAPTDIPTITATNTNVPPTATDTPTDLPIPLIVATLDANATAEQATLNVEETIAARATEYARATQAVIDATATATLWTFTPTANITASIEAYRTAQAATTTQVWIDSWTDTPTPTPTFTSTYTHTPTFTQTSTPTSTYTPTLTVLQAAYAQAAAYNYRDGNAAWQPVTHTFADGVNMMLVPPGCFMMGSNGITAFELPVHEQCIHDPFWIDQTEVSNADYARFIDAGGYANEEYWTEEGWAWREENDITQPEYWTNSRFNAPQQPVVGVSWYEAVAYANWRAEETGLLMHLPTEREWEYAARGPNELIYPWGNIFTANNIVYNGNSNNHSANVGSRSGGVSWVGAFDLSGNVWEWMSSLCSDYPYAADDGRETMGSIDRRCLRGGSWFNDGDFARAALRNRYFPNLRSIDRGFRVVVSSSGF